MNNQGKRPEQYTNRDKAAWYSIVGMILLLILASLLGGCVTTQEVPKSCCESKKACSK